MTKYKEYVKKMLAENKEVFNDFRLLHQKYDLDQEAWQETFNKEGEKILEIVREYENKLCRQTEKAGYSLFSGKLAEKFMDEVRKEFPLIDNVGIISIKSAFNLKKINLT